MLARFNLRLINKLYYAARFLKPKLNELVLGRPLTKGCLPQKLNQNRERSHL